MPKKILLADDSITIQKVVELTFSDGDYEVIATNNGAKAIGRLAEVRPDIILSDIIMPEKNGYEVCEYVKSHPEFRHIPVVLLTGTFEPFDPDRAEKAGCDAVVTKPFESQSLIHKVEELIAQSASGAQPSAAAAAPEAESTPFEQPAASPFAPSPFEDSTPAEPAWSSESYAPEAPSSFTSGATVERPFDTSSVPFAPASFEAPPAAPPIETPFEEPPAFPGPQEEQPAFASSSSFEESAPPALDLDQPSYSGETRAFPAMSFDEMQRMQQAAAESTSSKFELDHEAAAPPQPDPGSGAETKMIPKLTFDDIQRMQPTSEPEPQPSPFGQEEEPMVESGETKMLPKLSFDDIQRMKAEQETGPAESSSPFGEEAEEPSTTAVGGPWDMPEEPAAASPFAEEAPSQSAEASAEEVFAPPVEEPAEAPSVFDEPAASTFEEEPMAAAQREEQPAFAEEAPMYDERPTAQHPRYSESPFEAEQEAAPEAAASEEAPAFDEQEAMPTIAERIPEAVWSATEPESIHPEPTLAPIASAAATAVPVAAASMNIDSLSQDQIDAIARRVVEMMSEQVVRNIAWEVIPDMAELVIKERIRQLENEPT